MKTATQFQLITVSAAGADADAVRGLFVEYGKSLGFNSCFGGFEQELLTLPGDYAPPRGRLLLAKGREGCAGCVGVRALDDARCEMKRLYVQPAFRSMGLGRKLAEAALAAAREVGYRRMVLDTLPTMKEARALYAALGFAPCTPYYDNACAGSDCFDLKL